MSITIGLDPNRVTPNPEFGVGDFGEETSTEYVYVKVNGAIGARGEVVVFDTDGNAHPLTTSVDLIGRRCRDRSRCCGHRYVLLGSVSGRCRVPGGCKLCGPLVAEGYDGWRGGG